MILILVAVVFVFVLIFSGVKFYKESVDTNVNGPLPLPLIGNAHMCLVPSTDFLNLLYKFSQRYGDPFRFHIFSKHSIVVSHPKLVEAIVACSELNTKGQSYKHLTSWLGQGLLTASGHRWKTHRKFLTPGFHFNNLQNYLPVFCKNQRILTQKLRHMADGQSIDLFPIVALAALDNVTESIMGVCVDSQKNKVSAYVKAIEEISSIISMRMQISIFVEDCIFNLLPLKTRQDKALKIIHDQTRNVIDARRKELDRANITSLGNGDDVEIKNQHVFLDLLLLAEVDGKKLDSESVREEVDTFMFEGHDTVTSGLVYTLYCLSKHRDVQDKVYEELTTIFADNMGRDPTYHDLHQMKYLEMVLKESMRLFPPVPLIERAAVKDCQLGNIKLRKGTNVTINIYQLQRNPEVFEDPLQFKPERFEAPLKNPFSWMAFSAGARNCIGQKFAMMELKVTISEMVKNFIILPTDDELLLSADLILRSKNGVHIKLKSRH